MVCNFGSVSFLFASSLKLNYDKYTSTVMFCPIFFKFDLEIVHLSQCHVSNAIQLPSQLPFVQRFNSCPTMVVKLWLRWNGDEE